MQKIRFENRSDKWNANLIEIPENFVECIKVHGDEKRKYQPWTKYGVYQEIGRIYLEPYAFTKAGAIELSKFCNKFLELLGFTNFVEQIKRDKPNDDFVKTFMHFQEGNLGL